MSGHKPSRGSITQLFTPGGLEVMQVLWEHGSLKPAEIQEFTPRPIKNAAVRSVLRGLLERGHVTRKRIGRAYVYRAKTSRQQALERTFHDLANMFGRGSRVALIAEIIRMENLSEEEISLWMEKDR